MPKATRRIPKHIQEIISSLERIEKIIRRLVPISCIDFTTQPIGVLAVPPNTYSVNSSGHTFTFSSSNIQNLPLEIRNYPVNNTNNFIIPYQLTIEMVPPCLDVEVEVSSYARLSWRAFDISGGILPTIPPPPAPHTTPSHKFTVNGDVARLEFKSQNEEGVLRICFIP
jgi:hypothetical protein